VSDKKHFQFSTFHFQFCLGAAAAGLLAGAVNGIFGGAGGMVLIPLLGLWTDAEPESIFPLSVCVMLPVCLVSLWFTAQAGPLPWSDALPYLLGSTLGGILAGRLGQRVPTLWLHRIFGAMLLWGGIRYLW
jgi:uncharacterized membrane protein YfcA